MSSHDQATSDENVIQHQYSPFHLLDPTSLRGKNVFNRLHNEPKIWLTTVDEKGTPNSLPVGFLWDETQSTILIYSAPKGDRDRLNHISKNSRVGLHFDEGGKDIIIITGEAKVCMDDPPCDQVPAWVEKYEELFSHIGMNMHQVSIAAPIAIRVQPLMLRYVPNPFR